MSEVERALPRSAVVLCSYNGERFLPAQLASLRAQSHQPDVYVLSDDASTDATWSLLQAFADERGAVGCEVLVHRNENNLGYVRHIEQALRRADAEVLFPCDQDDVWHVDKIARMLGEFARRPGLLMLHGDARLVDAGGQPLGRRLFQTLEVSRDEMESMHAGRGFDVLLRRNIVTGAAMAFRSALLRKALPVADEWAHDEWIAIIAATLGCVDTLEADVIDYRQHGGNQIGVKQRSLAQRHLGIGVGRREFLTRLAVRQRSLLERAQSIADPIPEGRARIDEIAERLLHAEARSDAAAQVRDRMNLVIGEWRTGRYRRFGSGWRSALSDLLGLD